MFKYGVRGTNFNLFKSYLTIRKRYVNADVVNWKAKTITHGVPHTTTGEYVTFATYNIRLIDANANGLKSYSQDIFMMCEYFYNSYQLLLKHIDIGR